MKTAVLPKTLDPARYYDLHVGYVANILKDAGVRVSYAGHSGDDICGNCMYEVLLDDQPALIDYYDFQTTTPCRLGALPTFKFGYSQGLPEYYYPFTGPGIYDWALFRRVREKVTYQADGVVVAGHGLACSPEAQARRTRLMCLVRDAFGSRAITRKAGGEEHFWMMVNHTLVATLVPGSADGMPTRAYHQYFALGCCVISPPLVSVLPHYQRWQAGVHYLECRPDFADVPALVRWCEGHKPQAIQIGKNAAALFKATSTPKALVAWMDLCLNGGQNGA
jgi:hypothetical protein